MHRWDEAEAHFRVAIDLNQRLGAMPWLAHTRHAYAQMLLDRHGPGPEQLSRGFEEQRRGKIRPCDEQSVERGDETPESRRIAAGELAVGRKDQARDRLRARKTFASMRRKS
jgi:hypothetical protein